MGMVWAEFVSTSIIFIIHACTVHVYVVNVDSKIMHVWVQSAVIVMSVLVLW